MSIEEKQTRQEGRDMRGHVLIELHDENGELKQRLDFDNTFTDVGDAHVADRLAATSDESAMSHMAIGTGSTPFTTGSTALTSELDRNALDSGYPEQQTGANDNDVVYKATWAAGDGTGAITEAGVFNASSSGTMLCASTFSVINKGASDTLTITWTVTVG